MIAIAPPDPSPATSPHLDRLGMSRAEAGWFALVAVFAAWCCNVVYLHAADDIIEGLPEWHEATMDNQSLAPLQYRVFSFIVPDVLDSLGVGLIDAYTGLRFVYLAIAFLCACLIGRRLGLDAAGATAVALAIAVYYAASTQEHHQPAEEPMLAVFELFVLLALARARFLWFVPLVVIGTLTKDTTGFLLPFFVLVRLLIDRRPLREVVRDALVLSAIFVVGYIGIRAAYGTDREYLGEMWQLRDNVAAMVHRPFRSTLWLLPSLLPLAVLARRWSATPLVVRCFAPTVVLFVIGHLAISRVEEFRTYTPLALVLWPAVVAPVLAGLDQPRPVDR